MGPRPLPLLLLALLLPGCAGIERGFSRLTDGLTDFSGRYGPQWGGMRAASPGDSLTVQRVRAGGVAPDPAAALRPEPGDMWPADDAPRATLANPDEALRGIGNQRMGLEDPGNEIRRGRRGSSSPPPDALSFPSQRAPANVVPPNVPIPEPPPRPFRADGQVLPTTRGPTTTTTSTGNVSTTLSPQGPGVAIRDGAVTTIIEPGRVEQVPTPR